MASRRLKASAQVAAPRCLELGRVEATIEEQKLADFDRKLTALGLASPRTDQLSFIFHTGDNLRVYLFESGPWDFLRQEVMQARCHVFIAKLGGNDPDKIAEFAALSGAELVIPCYHDHRGREFQLVLEEAMEARLGQLSRPHWRTLSTCWPSSGAVFGL